MEDLPLNYKDFRPIMLGVLDSEEFAGIVDDLRIDLSP